MNMLVSQIIVLVFGIAVIGFAGWGIIAPGKILMFATSAMDRHSGIYIAVLVRVILGVVLISVAPVSSFPITFRVLGSIAIVVALALAVAGRERTRRFIAWWSERSSATVIRLWLLLGIALGAFLVYGVL